MSLKMRTGGLTAVNCTCAAWEGFRATVDNIAQWKQWFREHDDIPVQVFTTEDIRRAKREGKTGIYLGWQNTYPIEDASNILASSRRWGPLRSSPTTHKPGWLRMLKRMTRGYPILAAMSSTK